MTVLELRRGHARRERLLETYGEALLRRKHQRRTSIANAWRVASSAYRNGSEPF